MDRQKLLERLRQLADMPLNDLRTEYAIAEGLTTSSAWDDRRVAKGKTRGQLIAAVIDAEFFDTTD